MKKDLSGPDRPSTSPLTKPMKLWRDGIKNANKTNRPEKVYLSGLFQSPSRRFFYLGNNTDAPAWNLKISATARDDAGNILGTGSAILLTPTFAAPGGVVFGTVGFMDTSLESATIEYLVTADTTPVIILARRDLEVLEHNIVGKNIVGTLLNSNVSPLNLIQATVICFDNNLVPVVAPSSFTDQERVDAAAELPFSVNLFNDAAKCGRYFLAANGFETH